MFAAILSMCMQGPVNMYRFINNIMFVFRIKSQIMFRHQLQETLTGNQILTTASSRNSPDEKQASIFLRESTGIIETETNRIQKAILGSNTQRIDRHQMPINYTNWFYVVELRVSRNSAWKSIYNSCFFVVCDVRTVLICWLATIYN